MKRKTKHFLVVEDNPDDAFILMRAFRTIAFCSAYISHNMSEARAYLAAAGIYGDRLNFPFPDGILIGFRSGTSSALEFIRSLTTEKRTLPLFVLTGGAPPADIESLSHLGVTEVIEKPSSGEAVRELLQRLVHDLCEETPHSSPGTE